MCIADNIYVLLGLTTYLLNNNKQLYCTLIDFSKAFDYVVRNILCFKLIKYGVGGKMLDIAMSMYQNISLGISWTISGAKSFHVGQVSV